MKQSMPALELFGVSTGYGDTVVLEDVDLSLERGSVLGVVGPNGAGKTTLLRAITGILPLHRGEIRVMGCDLGSWSRPGLARALAVVPQSSPLIFDFTVREIVSMGRMPHQSPWSGERRVDRDAVDRALVAAEVSPLEGRSYLELSGGEQRRVLFARALAQEPSILLLDEPTSHLDPGQGRGLMERARDLARRENIAVLTILHDLNMAALYCDEIAVFKAGRVWSRGTPGEVFTQEALSRVYGLPVAVISHPHTGDPQVLINPSGPRDSLGSPGAGEV